MNFVRRCFRQDLPPYDVGNEDEETVGEAQELTVLTTSTMASSPIEAQSSCDKKEELLKALKERQLDIDKIKRLIEDDKIDINSVDQYSNTVLHLAIRKVENEDSKYVDFVKYLLKNKADIKARNMANETPFLLAARLNKHSVIRILAEQEGNEINAVNSPQFNTALHIAVLENHPKVVKLLRTLPESLGLQEDKLNKSNLTPLDICLASDYPEVGKEVKEIMKSKREDLHRSSSQEGATAMCSDEASACEAPSERNQRERGKSSSKEDTTSLDSNSSSKDSESDGAGPIPSSPKGKSIAELDYGMVDELALKLDSGDGRITKNWMALAKSYGLDRKVINKIRCGGEAHRLFFSVLACERPRISLQEIYTALTGMNLPRKDIICRIEKIPDAPGGESELINTLDFVLDNIADELISSRFFGSWKDLAGKLGYPRERIDFIEGGIPLDYSPTKTLITKLGQEGKSVSSLLVNLKQIERYDVKLYMEEEIRKGTCW